MQYVFRRNAPIATRLVNRFGGRMTEISNTTSNCAWNFSGGDRTPKLDRTDR